MRIIINFPKEFFTNEQLSKLGKYDLRFVEGDNIDLEKLGYLYTPEDLILSVNPAYLKEDWEALPVERIKKMKGLKALCLSTTSYSWVDTKKLAKMGIIVTNAPGKSTNAVAEFAIFMMFSLLRKMPLIVKNDWILDLKKHLSNEVQGLTAGIIGLGQIGTRLAKLCRGLEMDVCYWNRSKKKNPYKAVALEELFKTSDVVFCTIATPSELKGFLNKELISKLNEKAIIVTTSDTHVFDENFILSQVEKGKLGGYAFESNERKLKDYKGNVMVFPEQAFYTEETQKRTARILTESILSVIRGKLKNVVN